MSEPLHNAPSNCDGADEKDTVQNPPHKDDNAKAAPSEKPETHELHISVSPAGDLMSQSEKLAPSGVKIDIEYDGNIRSLCINIPPLVDGLLKTSARLDDTLVNDEAGHNSSGIQERVAGPLKEVKFKTCTPEVVTLTSDDQVDRSVNSYFVSMSQSPSFSPQAGSTEDVCEETCLVACKNNNASPSKRVGFDESPVEYDAEKLELRSLVRANMSSGTVAVIKTGNLKKPSTKSLPSSLKEGARRSTPIVASASVTSAASLKKSGGSSFWKKPFGASLFRFPLSESPSRETRLLRSTRNTKHQERLEAIEESYHTMFFEVCDFCGAPCLDPFDSNQRQEHITRCIKDLQRDIDVSTYIEKSRGKECGICLEVIMDKPVGERMFAILPNCNHCYCLGCVKKIAKEFKRSRRENTCPECRTPFSSFCPSAYWVESLEEKLNLFANYGRKWSEKNRVNEWYLFGMED